MIVAPAPIVVTATFDPEDFAWLDGLRRRHFPAERNVVPAHLTLFHHLPPSAADELREQLALHCRREAPRCALTAVRSLGSGVAFGVASDALADIRECLADRFAALLTPQDRAGWRPHITIQNKVSASDARALFDRMSAGFTPRPLRLGGLASWWYRGGPWEPLSSHSFSRSAQSRRS